MWRNGILGSLVLREASRRAELGTVERTWPRLDCQLGASVGVCHTGTQPQVPRAWSTFPQAPGDHVELTTTQGWLMMWTPGSRSRAGTASPDQEVAMWSHTPRPPLATCSSHRLFLPDLPCVPQRSRGTALDSTACGGAPTEPHPGLIGGLMYRKGREADLPPSGSLPTWPGWHQELQPGLPHRGQEPSP